MIHPSTLIGEEKVLYNRALEMADRAEKRDRSEFTFFLNPREQEIVRIAIGDAGLLFGGYKEAERKMLGIIPKGLNSDFPIKAIEILNKKNEKLNHRWVLGSLMSMGIIRGNIGDIIPETGSCTIICTENIEPILLSEIKKIGSNGVSVNSKELSNLISSQEFSMISGTLSSVRLDNLVALFTRLSREKSSDLFKAQKIQHNYKIEEKGSVFFKLGDIITIKGYGKFIVDFIGPPTKKGRLPIGCRKYL